MCFLTGDRTLELLTMCGFDVETIHSDSQRVWQDGSRQSSGVAKEAKVFIQARLTASQTGANFVLFFRLIKQHIDMKEHCFISLKNYIFF